MKIAINAIPYVRWSGIETFLYNLLKNWPESNADEIIVYANQKSAIFLNNLPTNIKIKVINFKKTNRLSFFLWQQFKFPYILKKERIDLLFCASLLTPFFYRKKITTIHDAAPFVLKDENNLIAKIFWRINLWFGIHTSLKMITVSEFSKKELIKYLKVDSDKLEVIYNGSPQIITTNYLHTEKNKKYLITIGNARPRKNLETLFKAITLLKNEIPDLKLLIIGKMDKRMANLKQRYSNENIVFAGFIEEEKKYDLIKNSIALVFPSLYEGFGLPIVEAGVLKTPVICSDIPAFREITNGSALFFEPKNEKDLVEKIKRIINSEEVANNLGNKGFINSQRFNWQTSSQKLLNIIHSYAPPPNK